MRISPEASSTKTDRIPVILVTDIGTDIDDTWALALLLKSPELDLKLAITDRGNPLYRAKIIAKFLQIAGHEHVPIGLEVECQERDEGPQAAWVNDYDLDNYPGVIHQNGAKAMANAIMSSPQAVTVISIGSTSPIAAALSIEPKIVERTRFVGMLGSLRLGINGSPLASAESNVVRAVKSAQQVLAAPWDVTITPLDTCGLVTLDGVRYRRVLKSKDPVVAALIENYRIWSRSIDPTLDAPAYRRLLDSTDPMDAAQAENYRIWSRSMDSAPDAAERHSTVLHDTVAVYLSIFQDLCVMERLNIRVTNDGFTKVDPIGKQINVATAWKDLDAYKEFLVNRLLAARQ